MLIIAQFEWIVAFDYIGSTGWLEKRLIDISVFSSPLQKVTLVSGYSILK